MPKAFPTDRLFFEFKLTAEQKVYVDALYSDEIDVIFCDAAAGTGKTTLAVAAAKILHAEGRHKGGLLYTFSPVEEGKMGFRPGTQHEKEQDYIQPLKDALLEINENPMQVIVDPDNPVDKKNKPNAWVEALTHIFARGSNRKNRIIIIDEAQNWTVADLRKMLTRIHDNCKVIVIGHRGQCDLKDPRQSGFVKYMEHYRNEPRAAVVELTENFRGWIARHADALVE